jgi:hypothetical protein
MDIQLLDLVCEHLLLLNQDFRSIDLFMTDRLFTNNYYAGSYIPFKFPKTDQMYRSGGIPISGLSRIFRWYEHLNAQVNYPMIVLSNAMDFVIQHAHMITEKSDVKLFVMVALWLMEKIYAVRFNGPKMHDYLSLPGKQYTGMEFMEMVNRFERTGFLDYESLYFQLPNLRLAVKGVLMMIHDLERYIEYGTPRNCARDLMADIREDDIPKNNGAVGLQWLWANPKILKEKHLDF